MASVNLTDAALARYKPKSEKDEIFDKQARGLGVRITRSSTSFFFVRRVKGQKIRFSLGQYSAVSLAEARKQAFDILDRIKKGEDPREEYGIRRKERAEQDADTFAQVSQRFITEYCEGKKTPLSERTVKGYRWALQGDLTEKWSAKHISEIADLDVIKVIDKLETGKHFASARLFRAYLSKFFNWAIGKRLIRENPTRGISLGSTPSDFKRERVLSLAELRTVLDAADGQGEPWRGFLQTLILTGQRRGETSMMKWAEVDLDGEKPLWRIPAENTKNGKAHEVPLAPEVVSVIRSMARLGPYVFTTNGATPISGFSKMKAALDKALPDLDDWRIHDLRRSVSTGMGELGFAPHIIEMVLNHISGEKAGVSGLYNRSRYDADCRRALAAWAQAVTAKPISNVVQMR